MNELKAITTLIEKIEDGSYKPTAEARNRTAEQQAEWIRRR